METIEEVYTTKGLIPVSALVKKEGFIDNDNEYTTWVEYYDKGELVHRSSHITLKPQSFQMGSSIGGF